MAITIHNIHHVKEWFEVLQTTDRSQTAVMVLDGGRHSSEEMNTHEKSDQVLLVVEGELHAEIGGAHRVMRSGDVCIVPAGTPHRFDNRTGSRAVTFNVYAPPEYAPDEKG
jgi:mannose-6-phosphate isomerase-like protein (cupin superfamily)